MATEHFSALFRNVAGSRNAPFRVEEGSRHGGRLGQRLAYEAAVILFHAYPLPRGGGFSGTLAYTAELVEAPGIQVLEVEGDDPVLEAGGGVGQADPLLDLVKRQALFEGQCIRNVLRDRESNHDVLSISGPQELRPVFRPALVNNDWKSKSNGRRQNVFAKPLEILMTPNLST